MRPQGRDRTFVLRALCAQKPVSRWTPLADLEGALAGSGGGDGSLGRRLAQTLAEHQVLARADRRQVERLFAATTGARVSVPRLESDVHDLAGLASLAAFL